MVLQIQLSFYTLAARASSSHHPSLSSFPHPLGPCRCQAFPSPHLALSHPELPWEPAVQGHKYTELARPPPQGLTLQSLTVANRPEEPQGPFPVLRGRQPRVKGT